VQRQEPTTPAPATPPDPAPDRPRTPTPVRIAALLHVVRILLAYGRHLADTLAARAATPSLMPIAAGFGTTNLSLILAHLHRGILRAAALEHVLLARAALGRDLAPPGSRARPNHRHPTPAPPDQPAAPPAARTPPSRPAWRFPCNPAIDFHTPTLQQLEAQVRRRPLGRTVADICLDLAVVPGLCTGTFWNALFDIMQGYGGSVAHLMRERFRREQAFHQQQDRSPTPGWDLSNLRRHLVRHLLGFFIGEPPMLPFHPPPPGAPAAAIATGPP
jgi:hypothetical protein